MNVIFRPFFSFLILVIAFAAPAAPLKKESPAPPKELTEKIVAPLEFAYVGADKLRVPLRLTGKVIVHFPESQTHEAMTEYLKQYAPAEVEPIAGVYPRAEVALRFPPEKASPAEMVAVLKKMTLDPKIEALALEYWWPRLAGGVLSVALWSFLSFLNGIGRTRRAMGSSRSRDRECCDGP